MKIVFTGRKFVVMYATNHPHLLKQSEWKSLAKNLGVTPERVGRTNAKCFKIERERRDAASFARKKDSFTCYLLSGCVSFKPCNKATHKSCCECLSRPHRGLFLVV